MSNSRRRRQRLKRRRKAFNATEYLALKYRDCHKFEQLFMRTSVWRGSDVFKREGG